MVDVMSIPVQRDHPIRTWFEIGGRAERYVDVDSLEMLRGCLELDAGLRVLGDGANLLVDDDGVEELVVRLPAGGDVEAAVAGIARRGEREGLVRFAAGADLREAINQTVRAGWSGLETLGGIPATLGGAVVMNAGGAFGQIADVVHRVHLIDRSGAAFSLDRGEIGFSYRHSGLGGGGGAGGAGGAA